MNKKKYIWGFSVLIVPIIVILSYVLHTNNSRANGNLTTSESNVAITFGTPQVFQPIDYNTKIQLSLMDNTYPKLGSTLFLIVKNISENTIVVPFPPEVILLKKDGSTLTRVENQMNYSGVESIVLHPYGNKFSDDIIPVSPAIDANAPVRLIVTVHGYVSRNGKITDEEVGAFMNLTLQP